MESDVSTEHAGCAVPCASRRAVLAAMGAAGVTVALAGCQTYGNESTPAAAPPAAPPPPATPASPSASGKAAEPPPPAGIAKVSDVPVGGGKVLKAQRVVLTQPQAGTIKAFSTVCTHQGCDVNEVADGTINCPCHGSKFKIDDGAVADGPARKPLPPVAVTVTGGSIALA
jgi:Rieske Fe-S protein